MRKTDKRQMLLRQQLEKDKVLYLADLAKALNLSKETIRKDFDDLAMDDNVERIHGGIRLKRQAILSTHYVFNEKKLVRVESKKAIAYKALSYIDNGQTIYLDCGTTVSYVFEYLSYKSNVRVVTPSIPLLMLYAQEETKAFFESKQHQFIFIGGHVNHHMQTTHGPFFDSMMKAFNIDTMFLSGDAFDFKKGLSNADEVTVSIINAVRPQAHQCIVLVDESKVSKCATFQCLSPKYIDVVITDYMASEDDIDYLSKVQCHFEYVKTK